MAKKNYKYYFILLVLLIILAAVEYIKPKPIDWRETYDYSHKIPFGTFVFRNTIPFIFPDNEIEENNKTIYEYSKKNKNKLKNYIFITEHFDIGKIDINTIFNITQKGNNVLIAVQSFNDSLLSRLKIKDSDKIYSTEGEVTVNFTNNNFKENKFTFKHKYYQNNFLSSFDTASYTILAVDNEDRAIFVRKKIGNGYIYIFTNPKIFTNFSMVTQKNSQAVYNILSYLPNYDIVLDDYYKPYKTDNSSIFKYIYQNESLRFSYYILLASLFLFIIFKAKREQRYIPIILPYKNTTITFANTLGRLYLKSKNNKDIIIKKVKYFKEHLNSKYYLNNTDFENSDYSKIAEKTGVDIENIKAICIGYKNIENVTNITDEQLFTFNKNIEKFYKNKK